MAFCRNCGSNLPVGAEFCSICGSRMALSMAAAAGSPVVEVRASPCPMWHVTFATGQTGGPYTEDEIRSMIVRQQIKISDAIVAHGGTTWVPITQSPFAPYVVGQASIDRMASSTCPRCGGAMIVVLRRSTASKVLIYGGIFTVWLVGFGFILIIIGCVIGRNPEPRYECPRCKYKAA
jgi:hypothetical protein